MNHEKSRDDSAHGVSHDGRKLRIQLSLPRALLAREEATLAKRMRKGYSIQISARSHPEESMSNTRDKYIVAGVDLYHVRNRNEQRVIRCLQEEIDRLGMTDIPPKVIEDSYALALNNLPARYAQQGTIVLRDPVKKMTIEDVVTASVKHVINNPKN